MNLEYIKEEQMAKDKVANGRRKFLGTAGAAALGAAAGPLMNGSEVQAQARSGKLKLAMVGTGIRGTGLWGKTLNANYNDVVDFVGLCDINYKRVAFGKEHI